MRDIEFSYHRPKPSFSQDQEQGHEGPAILEQSRHFRQFPEEFRGTEAPRRGVQRKGHVWCPRRERVG